MLQFIRTVPVTWDETRVLPQSKIGELVLIGRRKGDAWYVAALNCRAEAAAVTLDLAFVDFSGKEVTTYLDGDAVGSAQIQSGIKPPTNNQVSLNLKPGGGGIIHIAPRKEYSGWK